MKISFTAASAILLAKVASVAAHGGVIGYSINGVYYPGFRAYVTPVGQTTIQREWDSYNPITSTTDATLSCNANGAALATGQLSATVAAGSKVTAYWNNNWEHTIGPVMVYMASCGSSCTSATTSALNWFKIDQRGLVSGTVSTGVWGMAQMVAANVSWTSTIPSTLAPGNYLIRHELLAIHTSNSPQFYPECAQLTITGGGTKTGTPTVKFPGAYSASDPSININIYAPPASTATTYAIPGPAVFTG